MKKTLSMILAVIMALSTLTCFGTTAFALDYDAVLTGPTTFTRTIKSEGYTYFKFTPKRTGAYYFYYRDQVDLKCYIYDSEDKVAHDDYLVRFDDNYIIGDYGLNFITDPFTFVAGTEYVFKIYSYEDDDVTANFVLSRVAPSDYDFVRLEAVFFNIPEPQVGDAVEDFEFSTTTFPSGYGATGTQYWETSDDYFQDGVTYSFDGDDWVDYDRSDWNSTTRLYVNGKYVGTFGDASPCFYVCSHKNTTKGVVPATCTADGYTNGTVCADCGKAFANGTTVIPKSATIRKSATTFNYNGKVQRPLITVFDRNGTQLTYKKDFTVSYSNWNSVDPGTYYVYVQMVGNYNDFRVYSYTINPITGATPKLNKNTITYNGTVQRPSVTVTDANGKALEYKEDFVVSYSNFNSKEVGRYTVTVTMVGGYKGTSYTYPYYINPKGTTFLTSAQGGFTGIKNGFTLKWNKQTNNTTGYQIQYSTKSDFSNAATIYAGPSSATSKTVTGRASKTRYYVRIRTYKNVGGKYFYSNWSTGTKSVVTL